MRAEINSDHSDAIAFASRCLSIDLEVGKTDARIHQIGAIQPGAGDGFPSEFGYKSGPLLPALQRLDAFARGAEFNLGHNIVVFDIPHLASAKPDLDLLGRAALDTLWLNPLAFPRNPYHHLVKHYQDGQLKSGHKNDPIEDSKLTVEVLVDQFKAFRLINKTSPNLLIAWHFLTSASDAGSGFDALFQSIRGTTVPSAEVALQAINSELAGKACKNHGREVAENASKSGWSLAYALAWLSVAGGNSVIPPWVKHQFPKVGALVKKLRDTPCGDPQCSWCSERHDSTRELNRWFPDIPGFRPTPVDDRGAPLQRAIVDAAIRGDNVLAILPTGTGKSICYQVPALSRFDKTGALTVVISPLVALMADQVNGLEARGIGCSAAINGLLSMPERALTLERIRLGDIGILIVSPEQLRNRTLRNVLAQREIGAWILDEAHCISKWGHDFRPDYRYVGRFIKERAGNAPIPPIMCLTATAKPDVIRDMMDHFLNKVGVTLNLFDGGASRTNLSFEVLPTTPSEKYGHVLQILMHNLPPERPGGAIVYCSTRKKTEEVANFLRSQGLTSGFFHAGMPPQTKKSVQGSFINGELRVIAATNAFGMGIDKPDVRLVIHADIPGSLENYLQEAGRAGRDREDAKCVLLYTPDDVERQFGMSARSRLTQREIQSVLKSLRNLDRKKKRSGEVVATSGEILAEESDGTFERDSATDDTRVRTAVAWLEEATLLQRDENLVTVFPSSLRVKSLDDARQKLAKIDMFDIYRGQLLQIVEALFESDPDDGISTDELMGRTGLSPEMIRKAMSDLESLGISSNDMALTAFVHVAVADSSSRRLEIADALERDVIDALRSADPDLGKGESSILQLRHMTQYLKDNGHPSVLPEDVHRIIKSLSEDGRSDGGVGSIRLRKRDSENLELTLQREWSALATTAQMRRSAAVLLLGHLLEKIPSGSKGKDLLAETTMGELRHALLADIDFKSRVRNLDHLLERGLMWIHEQDVIQLNKGLAVFRPAMTIRLEQGRRSFTKSDFAPLELHYEEQVIQIHVMDEYVQRGLSAMAEAMRLAADYFRLDQDAFLRRWMPNRDKEMKRQTTAASWRNIVESLGNVVQQSIVADDREQTNVLVLAGPGSGKTRVLVHRIAYLIRVRREKPEGILALAYNRHAAVEIRRRLRELIGEDARGVLVMTCHAMAMRLVGASFTGKMNSAQSDVFSQVLLDAIALLKGEGLPAEDADEQRDRLLAGFRWILVDEYQDIGREQYDLISALAGRTRKDDEGKIGLFAVGDDDQNIYAFNGASVDFIRRFESDYDARATFLVENYRSTANIVQASNAVIAPAKNRMKVDHPIQINQARMKLPLGGEWTERDPVKTGKVQLLSMPEGTHDPMVFQAAVVMQELDRLCSLDPDWEWTKCAVIAREWRLLDPVRAWCEARGVPVQTANEESINFWRLRETQKLVDWVHAQNTTLLKLDTLKSWVQQQAPNPWWDLLQEALDAYGLEMPNLDFPGGHLVNWLAEWGREVRKKQTGVLLSTVHRAKGLEFDHVAILDGGWSRDDSHTDADDVRRLFYVGMTRAKKSLIIAQAEEPHRFAAELTSVSAVVNHISGSVTGEIDLTKRYLIPSMQEIDIGFSGRFAPEHPIHRVIEGVQPGDQLQLVNDSRGWMLLSADSKTVGKMAKSFSPPENMVIASAHVLAVQSRTVAMVSPNFVHLVKSDSWEVVIPELVFMCP